MNGQNFGEHLDTSSIVERTNDDNEDMNSPVENSDAIVDKAPLDATRIGEWPVDGTVATAEPVGEPTVHESQMSDAIPYTAPVEEAISPQAPIATYVDSSVPLLNRDESDRLRMRWNEIQGKFVDEPRSAVQEADALVSDVIEKITRMFTDEQSALEGQWKQGNDVSTEDLRQTLQHYRSFFNRLVV